MKRLAIIAALLASTAYAQPRQMHMPHFCMPTDALRKSLMLSHEERPSHRGITSGGGFIVEIWQSQDGGFTVLQISPDGLACVMTGGEALEPLPVAWGTRS